MYVYIYIYMIAIYVYIFIHNTYIASLYNSLFFFLKNIYIYIYTLQKRNKSIAGVIE